MYDWKCDVERDSVRCRRLAFFRAVKRIVSCQYGLLLKFQKHMRCQVCVRGLRLIRAVESALARVRRLRRSISLFSLRTPVESYEWLKTRSSAEEFGDVNLVMVRSMKNTQDWGWLDDDSVYRSDGERYGVWMRLDVASEYCVDQRREIAAN